MGLWLEPGMSSMSDYLRELEENGFVILREQLGFEVVDALIKDLDSAFIRGDKRGAGMRDLLNRVSSVRELADSELLRAIVEQVLGDGVRTVRGIYFDKQRDANWKVAWHQDLTIAVKERIEVRGFNAWSLKGGIQHVQPPVSILEHMISVRVHLDDADETNGCLRVIPGSHLQGRLSTEQINNLRSEVGSVSCVVKKGDVMVMRPLLLHASSISKRPAHRRVVHLEYCATDLPGGLKWFEERD